MKSKGIILFVSVVAFFISCTNGGGNKFAENLVLEELTNNGINKEQIDNIRSEETDSVISPVILTMLQAQLARTYTEYTKKAISKEECQKVFDDCNEKADDMMNSFNFGIVVNDSLRSVYGNSEWRKVYNVIVTMKSGRTKSVKVIMDNRGDKPFCTEKELMEKAMEYQNYMLDLYNDFLY